jgi:hypothetical protein
MSLITLTTLFLAIQSIAAVPRLQHRSISCPAANETTYTASNGHKFRIECGIDRFGGDLPAPNGKDAKSLNACIAQCVARSGCNSVQWVDNWACYLKSTINAPSPKSNVWGAVLETKSSKASKDTTSTTTSTIYEVATITVLSNPSVAPPSSSTEPSAEPSNAPSAAPAISSPDVKVVSGPAGTSTKASSAPASTPAGGSPGSCAQAKALGGKRGLAYNVPNLTTFFGSKVTWAYNWGQTPGSGLASSLMYIPMLWGSGFTSTWNTNAKAGIAAGADTLLSFNEPDLGSQSNIDPTTAANLYKQYVQPFACQARLSAPAVTNGGAPLGLTWLENFLKECTGCTIDIVPIHWYDSAPNIGYFQSYIQEAYVAGGNRTLWITEFGASGSDEEVVSFFQTVSF